MKVPEYYIIGKNKEWLIRVDRTAHNHVWSKYLWDAKKFDNYLEAKLRAREMDGELYRFSQITGKAERIVHEIPESAHCDNCKYYTPYDGVCRNPNSEIYRVPVSYHGRCEEWEAK